MQVGLICRLIRYQQREGGDILSFWATKFLREAGVATALPIGILFTRDEEIGVRLRTVY